MDKHQIEAELSADGPVVRGAVMRGLAAAYGGDWGEVEGEYSGRIMAIITAVRAAVEPLAKG